MNGRKERINVKLYDINERLYKKYTDKGPVPVQEYLINANQKFFQHEIAQIQSCDYSKVIIANGCGDQDKPGYVNTAPIVQSYFNKNLKCDTVLDPFWMADIYAGNLAGDNYKAVLKETHQGSINTHRVQSVQDHSRIATIYAHAHRAAVMNPGAKEIMIDYYHDTIPHLTSLYLFFDRNQVLLPKNMILRLHQFDESKISQHLQVNIQGTGDTDKLYEWSVRYLESQYHLTLGRGEANQRNINTANDLATYHYEDSYYATGRKIAMDINPDTFQLEKFLLFRNKEILANLAAMNLLGPESQYTTAAGLSQAGLLPGSFVLDIGINKNAAPAEKPVLEKPVEKLVLEKPVEKPVLEKPIPEKPIPEKPIQDKPTTEPKSVVINLAPPAAAPIPEKQPGPTLPPANLRKETDRREIIINIPDITPGTSPEFKFEFDDKKFVPSSPLVILPDKQPAPAAMVTDGVLKQGDAIIIDLDNVSPPTLPSKSEESGLQSIPAAAAREFVLTDAVTVKQGGKIGDSKDDLIISPEDVYTTNPGREQENPVAPGGKDASARFAEEDNHSGSDSESTSIDGTTASAATRASILNQKQNTGGDNVIEYLQNLYTTYENPKKNLSMTNYIKTLRNALQVHHLPVPNEFNALHAIKNIARLPCWQSQGGSLTLFWGKVPDGINEINKHDPATLPDLVKVVKESLGARSGSYFHGKRYPMTAEFYELILMLCEQRIDDQIRFVALNAFCSKWKITDSVMEVEIAPEFAYKPQSG